MAVYFEGDGKSRPVTITECRDRFIEVLKDMRDEVLNDPALEAYEDTPQRDLHIANRVIGGVLDIVEGDNPSFPAINLIPFEIPEEVEEAKAAGANYIDTCEFADFGRGLGEYWKQVNS